MNHKYGQDSEVRIKSENEWFNLNIKKKLNKCECKTNTT